MHAQLINFKNRVCNSHSHLDNLVKAKKLETKNDKKNYKDLTIHFTRYIHSKSIKMFSLDCHELMGKK